MERGSTPLHYFPMTDTSFITFDQTIENAPQCWGAFTNMLENLNAEYSPADHTQLARAVRAYADEKASDTENGEFLFHPKVQPLRRS